MMFAFLAAIVGRFMTLEILKMLALRAMILSLLIVVLPIVLENFLVFLVEGVFNLINANLGDTNIGNTVVEFQGLASWLALTLKLDLCLAVLSSAVVLRFVLSLIPFVRV